MSEPIPYTKIEDIHVMPNCDSSDRFCVRIFVPDGSILLQTNHLYARNQWFQSILWKRSLNRYRKIFETVYREEVLVKEVKNMVEQTRHATLQDDSILTEPLELLAGVLQEIQSPSKRFDNKALKPVIIASAPLLEDVCPTDSLSAVFSQYCQDNPRSGIIEELFAKVAHQILKRNMLDFGKYPSMRSFILNFIIALSSHNNGLEKAKEFVRNAHGPASVCPHPRVINNLLSACLAAVRSIAEDNKQQDNRIEANSEEGRRLECFTGLFAVMADYDDWRTSLSSIMQPIPFPDEVVTHPIFARNYRSVLRQISADPSCEVHLSVLGIREGRHGWFHLVCPGGLACADEGELYSEMLNKLLQCCCKRKKFLLSLNSMIGPLQLLILRENEAAMKAVCYMLELNLLEGGEEMKMQMIAALQSTPAGKKHYVQLCDREVALRELQQKGGPRKLTLPSKSTDQDLAVLLSSGSFGNLEWLSLAFTNVTSSGAECLIKLPALKYLNLWSTQFGDTGVQVISEHMHKLQVLNLCETPVTDKGLLALTSLKSLRKLNLNSTQLSAKTFDTLKAKLPALQEIDVRYTEAWSVEDTPES
jgi:hypothetical protein